MNDIEWRDGDREGLWSDMKNGTCEISPKIRHKKTTLREKGEYVLNTYAKTLKAYADQFGTKEITAAINEAVLSEKEIRLINNEKVIRLMKYRKQAEKRNKELQQVSHELKYSKGIWFEGRYIEEIEPDKDKLKQLSIC